MALLPNNGTNAVTAVAAAIIKIGVPAAIALFLVYMGAKTLPQMAENILLQRTASERLEELQRESIVKHEELLRMLQRVCSNTARDEEARQRCFNK
jgi:hypothetical protein